MIVLESNQNHAQAKETEVSPALPAAMGMGGGYVPMVVEQVYCIGNGQLDQLKMSDKVGALNCMHDQQALMVKAYGLDRASYNQGANAKFNISIEEEKIGAQTAKGPGAVFENEGGGSMNSVVRRLTPLECERLQGFPDNWTLIGEQAEDGEFYYTDRFGKRKKCSDSARYKALGNSIAVGYANNGSGFWMGLMKRISAQYERNATMGSLFDGIGGFPLAWEHYNGRGSARWASEIEEFCIEVTRRRFPEEE